jgi:hypothetical protein
MITLLLVIAVGRCIIRATSACMGKEGGSGGDVVLFSLELVDTKAEVAKVVLAKVEVEDLVDDRNQIVGRADGQKRRRGNGAGRTEDAARGGQDEGVFDNE